MEGGSWKRTGLGSGGGGGGGGRRVEDVRDVARGYGPPRPCFACKVPVRDPHFKTLRRQVFHENCLKCGTCGTVLEAHVAKVKANRIFCPLCYKKAFLPPCRACGDPVEPAEASVVDFPSFQNEYKEKEPALIAQAMFHAACLRCELPACGALLPAGSVFREGQRLYCSPACVITARAAPTNAQAKPRIPPDLLLSTPLLARLDNPNPPPRSPATARSFSNPPPPVKPPNPARV